MADDKNKEPVQPDAASASPRKLSPQAARALAEADERRAKAAKEAALNPPKEFQGPQGPEPTRFGDWERKGIASDF